LADYQGCTNQNRMNDHNDFTLLPEGLLPYLIMQATDI